MIKGYNREIVCLQFILVHQTILSLEPISLLAHSLVIRTNYFYIIPCFDFLSALASDFERVSFKVYYVFVSVERKGVYRFSSVI